MSSSVLKLNSKELTKLSMAMQKYFDEVSYSKYRVMPSEAYDKDCCSAVSDELNKVESRLRSIKRLSEETLDSCISNLEEIQQEIASRQTDQLRSKPTVTQNGVIGDILQKTHNVCKQLAGGHKDFHSSISKFGKSIDKNFHSDYSAISRDFHEAENIAVLNEVICEHFLRQGRLNIVESLIQDGSLKLQDDVKLPFMEMHNIIQDLKDHRLHRALSWAERNREELMKLHSTLEFNLHKMNFLMIIGSGVDAGTQRQAVLYARTHLQRYSTSHTKELQQLMGCMLFQDQGIENSPYAYLQSPDVWDKLAEEFSREACFLLGLPMESPLSISINAGTKALGPLLHITSVLHQKQINPAWGARDELPVEVDVGHNSRFHSVFACPILRQQTTDNNPPMRLVCGHVISKDAMKKLSNGQKLKCPYCPMEQSLADAVRLYL